MAMPAVFERLQKIPAKTRLWAFVGFIIAASSLFIYFVHIPKTTEIEKLDAEIAQLQTKIAENDAKIQMLDQLKAEVKSLEVRLRILTEQLPPESEVSGLLRQIQGLVNKSGLILKVWKPDRRKPHPSGLYEEIPISLELVGGYHNVAMFFDSVGKLTRIVNMLNVKMDQPKVGRGGLMEIGIKVTAMTFAAMEQKGHAAAPAAAKQVR